MGPLGGAEGMRGRPYKWDQCLTAAPGGLTSSHFPSRAHSKMAACSRECPDWPLDLGLHGLQGCEKGISIAEESPSLRHSVTGNQPNMVFQGKELEDVKDTERWEENTKDIENIGLELNSKTTSSFGSSQTSTF